MLNTATLAVFAVFDQAPDILQVRDFPEGPSQRPPGALAEWGPRLQLAGWVPVRERTISCEHAAVVFNCNGTKRTE